MVSEVETLLIGFGGGIVGGLIVNIVSYEYQKRREKKEEEEKYKTEYRKNLKSKLNEIIDTWNKELSKGQIERRRIQNEFDIYSNQLTSIISRAPDDFPEDIIKQLKELSTSLRKLRDFTFSIGWENYESFKKECQEIIDKAKEILI